MIKYDRMAQFASDAADYAVKWQYDGIDLATKLSGSGTVQSVYANNGSFVAMAKQFINVVGPNGKKSFTRDNIGISAPAPYWSQWMVRDTTKDPPVAYPDKALTWLAQQSTSPDEWFEGPCTLMMFDEEGCYMSYNDVFSYNNHDDPWYGTFGQGSAVKEVHTDFGVSMDRLVVLKPVTSDEYSVRSGYVDALVLRQWACDTQSTSYGDAWTGGFAAWTWNAQDTQCVDKWAANLINIDCSVVLPNPLPADYCNV